MTVEELKREADKLGYLLRKKPTPTILAVCKCGYSLDEIEDLQLCYYGRYYQCPKCKLAAKSKSKSNSSAKLAWNKLILKGK